MLNKTKHCNVHSEQSEDKSEKTNKLTKKCNLCHEIFDKTTETKKEITYSHKDKKCSAVYTEPKE